MKLSEYIKGLQEVLNDSGDLECYYARDDEGNGYQQVGFNGCVYYHLGYQLEHRVDSFYDTEDMEEYSDDTFIPVCVVN